VQGSKRGIWEFLTNFHRLFLTGGPQLQNDHIFTLSGVISHLAPSSEMRDGTDLLKIVLDSSLCRSGASS